MAAALLFGCFAAQASAINIVPVFNNVDNETPAFDLFNQGIQNLMDYAEGYYQDIIEDPGYTLTLNFWYEDLQDNYLGLYNTVTTSGGLVTEGNIRIDTREGNGGAFRDWYIDPFPATDTEFEMGKVLFEDLTGSQLGDYINFGTAPDALEVGYRGSAVSGGAAHLKYDMLSTILHEVGHALGIRSGATQSDDGDYDINPIFAFGSTVAAEIDTDEDGPDPGHMKPGTLLMCGGCGEANARRRPSHFDIMAMATSMGMTQLDLPRREFLGGAVFGVNGNWSGNRTPDANDEAYMRGAGLVTMNADDTVAGLNISGNTTLAIGSHSLNVNGMLVLEEGFSNATASIVVASTSQLIANDIRLGRDGELDMAGGVVSVLGDLDMSVAPPVQPSLVTGFGTVTVIGQFKGVGHINPDGGVLTINAGSFDLDGDSDEYGSTEIDATLGSVTFNGPHFGPIENDITFGFGRLVTFSHAWTHEQFGDLTITDGGLINNGTWTSKGQVVINHTVPFGIVGVGGTGAMVQEATGSITTSGIVDFLGHSTLGGALHLTTEAVRFSAGGMFSSTASVTLDPATELYLILANTYTVEQGATFTGSGAVIVGELATLVMEDDAAIGTSLTNNGRLEIGNSPGNAAVGVNYTQTSTGVAEFEIGGASLRNYDRLDVTGTATLDGALDIALINGYVPQLGATFQIITADVLAGTFDTITGATFGNGYEFAVLYSATDVLLEVTLPGDLNGDGFVGIADLNIVLSNWNQNVPPADPLADPSGDDFVGIADLNVVLGNWNAGTPPGQETSIPEPASVLMMMPGFAAVLRRKRGFLDRNLATDEHG
jgi:hypothetical protein